MQKGETPAGVSPFCIQIQFSMSLEAHIMALSEQEQKMLEQLEKQFEEDDPKFAEAMQAQLTLGFSANRIITGVLTAVAGISILLLGATIHEPTVTISVGVLGFAALIVGAYVATMSTVRREGKGRQSTPGNTTSGGTAPEKDSGQERT